MDDFGKELTTDAKPDEEIYRLFAEATEDGVLIHDNQRVLAVNSHLARMFGYEQGQLEGKVPSSLIVQGDRIPFDAVADEVASEALGLRADGSTFPLEFKSRAVTYQGRAARVARVRDLTRRRQAEATLYASEQRFRATFELAAIGIAHVATDGTWLRVNRRLCEMTGYAHDELLKITFQDITHPDDLGADLEQLNALLNGAPSDSYAMEKRYFRKDGTILWANLTVSLVKGNASNPPYLISIVEDISARKEIEETLRQAQKMEVMGQLTSSIAHDFGNFLNIIKGNLQLLEPYQISSRPSEYLKSAMAGADLAEKLIRQLLSFSRRQEPEFEAGDVNELIREVRSLLRRAAGDRATLKFALDEHGCPTVCDRAQLETALFNLVLNARDALGAAGGEITIATAHATNPADLSGRWVRIDVADTGHGMAGDVVARASEPFFTTKSAGQGTCLGLSQVVRCMAQMNGTMNIESQIGSGTTVQLFLPLNQSVAPRTAM